MVKPKILWMGLLIMLWGGLFNFSLVLAVIPATISNSEYHVSTDESLAPGYIVNVNDGGTLYFDSGVTVTFGSNAKVNINNGGRLIIKSDAIVNLNAAGLNDATLITVNNGGRLEIELGTTFPNYTKLNCDYGSGITIKSGGSMICGSGSGVSVQLARTGTGWVGLRNEGGTVDISKTAISGASTGVYQSSGQMTINNSIFNNCSTAIDAVGGICRIINNTFNDNGSGISLQDVSPGLSTTSLIAGNSFTDNEESIVMISSNNVNISFNNFADNSTQTAIRLGDTFLGTHVSISYNNFIHADSGSYIIENQSSSLVSVYNSYWFCGSIYTNATDLKDDLLITDSYVLAAPAFQSSPINYLQSDVTAPTLVDVSPSRSRGGTGVALTVILSDTGWGVNPATVQIALVDHENPSTILPATITNHHLSDRGHVFQATVTIPAVYESYYYWSVTAADFAGNSLTAAGSGYTLTITDQVDLFTTPAWGLESYQLITVPLTTAEADHKIALGLTQSDSKLARYPNGSGPYLYYGESGFESDLFEPGKGFWLYLGAGESTASRQVSGTPFTGTKTVDFSSAGWYLIGNPFSPSSSIANLPFTYLSFTYDGTPDHNFTQAVIDGKVGFGLWDYSSGSYHFERNQLTAWKGYWIRIKEPCSINFMDHLYGTASLMTWDLQLVAAQNGASDGANYLGLVRTAGAGVDRFDGEKPPALTTGLKSYFRPQGVTREFGADFRSASSTREEWRYVLTDLVPGEAVITWNGLNAVPANYRLVLKDLVTEVETDLRQNSSYRFTVTGETQREFDIIMRDVWGQGINISGIDLDRNPFAPRRGESVTVTFDLSAAATIEVRIYDWVGNLVYVFPNVSGDLGSNSFTWTGRNNRGTMVANGVYFAKLLVRSGSEHSSQVIKLVVRN